LDYRNQNSVVGWVQNLSQEDVYLWDLEFKDEDFRWTDNDEGEPKEDPDEEGCNPLGVFLNPPEYENDKPCKDFSWLTKVKDNETYFALVNQSGSTIK
jgi:hypothetical protein